MYSVYDAWASPMRIAPFGNLRIKICLLLPAAYRSLPRPSSALNAKAFSLRSLRFTIWIMCFLLFCAICSWKNLSYPTSNFFSFYWSIFVVHFFLICITFLLIQFSRYLWICKANPLEFTLKLNVSALLSQRRKFLWLFMNHGGHKWTRTTDLTLIRRAL